MCLPSSIQIRRTDERFLQSATCADRDGFAVSGSLLRQRLTQYGAEAVGIIFSTP
jgi:hypothetical protein